MNSSSPSLSDCDGCDIPPSIAVLIEDIWLCVCGFMVFFMQAGFALLEAGAIRTKHVKNILLKNTIDISIGALVYFAVGYAFAFGQEFAATSNGGDAATWWPVDNGFVGLGNFFLTGPAPVRFSHFFFQWSFSSAAATIVSGSMAERTDFTGYRLISILTSGLIYPVVTHWVWSKHGWLRSLGYSDFAGASCVHMVGGLLGLLGAVMLGPRIGRFEVRGAVSDIDQFPAVTSISLSDTANKDSHRDSPSARRQTQEDRAPSTKAPRRRADRRKKPSSPLAMRSSNQERISASKQAGLVGQGPAGNAGDAPVASSIIGSGVVDAGLLMPLSTGSDGENNDRSAAERALPSPVRRRVSSQSRNNRGVGRAPISPASSGPAVSFRPSSAGLLSSSFATNDDATFGYGQVRVGSVIANVIPPHAPLLSLLGTFILFFGWYGFNCGSVPKLVRYPNLIGRVATVTTICGASSSLLVLSYTKFRTSKYSLSAAMNGLLSGLVSSTAVAFMIDTWIAIIVGIGAGFVYIGSSNLLIRLRIDDPLDAAPVHYFCGLWSILCSGLFARSDSLGILHSTELIPHPYGVFMGGGWEFLGVQLLGALAITVWTGVLGFTVLFLTRCCHKLRLPADYEQAGLDLTVHDGPAYPEFVKSN